MLSNATRKLRMDLEWRSSSLQPPQVFESVTNKENFFCSRKAENSIKYA